MARFLGLDKPFMGGHFERDVIVLCVRWYLRFNLSYRDLVEMMAGRSLSSWRVDETHMNIRGKWAYLYRAVDWEGDTVDFRLCARRDTAAAKAFLREAIKSQEAAPKTITLDGYAASHRAVREMKIDRELPKGTEVRSSKHLNSLIEQDHRGLKSRIGPMLCFCRWRRESG
jgi:transposase-like protein